MRTLAPFLFLLCTTALASPAHTLGARSEHHELRLDCTVVAPNQVAYDVVVVDLDSGKAVLYSHIKPGDPLDVAAASGGRQVRVHLADTPNFFTATVNVIEGETIVDEFRTWWQRGPRSAMPTTRMATPAPTLNAPGAYRVGGDVKAPIVIRRVEPLYPEDARRARISGIVIVEALIDKDGRVKDAVVLKPLPYGLDQSALDAVRQWEFKPATLNGEPVAVIFNLTINFKLDAPPPPQP